MSIDDGTRWAVAWWPYSLKSTCLGLLCMSIEKKSISQLCCHCSIVSTINATSIGLIVTFSIVLLVWQVGSEGRHTHTEKQTEVQLSVAS